MKLEVLNKQYNELLNEAKKANSVQECVRELCKKDLFFLMTKVLGREDMERQWLLDRCTEVQQTPNGCLDLWFREAGKSSIITFGLTIQDILNDPNITVGIFSYNRPTAKAFLWQIKREFESNDGLKSLFPEVLWTNPNAEAPRWSLASNTPVLTTHGWKNHGDLKIGDKIYGADGNVITVIGNSGPMENVKCYKVIFDDTEIIASGEHLWPVEYKKYTCSKWDDSTIKILQTTELKAKTKQMRMLPTPEININQNHDLLIDPYILGLWLGDGTSGTNIISMHRDDENELLKSFSDLGYEYYIYRKKPEDNFSMYGIRGLKEKLSILGCLKNKYIPDDYLYSSIENRRSLLQGLMDSDGHCKKLTNTKSHGMCIFTNTNKTIAEGVFFLATSLGFRPSHISCFPKYRGKKESHQIYFVGVKSLRPFRLQRKLDNCKDKRIMVGRYFKKIEEVESVIVNCIKVDSKDNLYLAGKNMVPTHNSMDEGIIVKRTSNTREATVEAWGLVDGQPTGRHFKLLIYDDVVTIDSVNTPEMCQKTTRAWEMSRNLGCEGGASRYIGTRYSFNDTYGEMLRREVVVPRIYPVYDENNNPVLLTAERIEQKRKEFGPYVFSSQMLQQPVADEAQNFHESWIKTWPADNLDNLNIYILVDPASKKKKNSDYTAMFVVGLGMDKNYYIIDMVRDRLNLTERTQMLFYLHKLYSPKAVGYEEYGMQSDIEHLGYVMEKENYRFPVFPLGGVVSKVDRIRALVPLFEQGRVYLPQVCIRTGTNGKTVDLTKVFIEEEYKTFPVGVHDDMMDALARILDHGKKGLFAVFPDKPIQKQINRIPSIHDMARMELEQIWEDIKQEESIW